MLDGLVSRSQKRFRVQALGLAPWQLLHILFLMLPTIRFEKKCVLHFNFPQTGDRFHGEAFLAATNRTAK